MTELRPYQTEAIDRLRESLRSGKRRPVLALPTGGGKTRIASEIVDLVRRKGKRIAFLVPALSLIDQTVEMFHAEGIRHIGVIQANHIMTDWSMPVQICSIQTLDRRAEFPDVDGVIVDECHRLSKLVTRWMFTPGWERKPFIGLSATPWQKGMAKLYDDLIIASTTQELIDAGYLSPFRVFAPTHPDLRDVKIIAGDYHEGQLGEAMNKAALVADVVETWQKLSGFQPTLCFAVDRAHAKALQKQFESAGISAAYMDAFTPPHERTEIREMFHRGQVRVVCNVGVLTTGVDWDVRCVTLARPTRSEILHVQILGRGLRTAEGKEYCIAEGQRVLTNVGLVPIERVTTEMRVWDGEDWVAHRGPICRGEQDVIGHCGLVATPDHKVWTRYGWKTFEECARRQIGIACTGRAGKSVRLSENHFEENAQESFAGRDTSGLRPSRMRDLYATAVDFLLEYCARAFGRVPRMQPAIAGAEMADAPNELRQVPLRKPALSSLRGLRREGHRVQVYESDRRGDLGQGQSGPRPIIGDRPDRQRRPLRAGQPQAIDATPKYVAYAAVEACRQTSCLQDETSGGTVFRCDILPDPVRRDNGSRDRGEMGASLEQTKRRVWDLLDAGPFHRFTVEGLLVKNCTILDHADNHARLGFVTDCYHDSLSDAQLKSGTVERRGKLPKECPSCHFLRAAGVATCPNCGFTPKPVSKVETKDGKLEEIEPKKGICKTVNGHVYLAGEALEKGLFYAQLRWIGAERGYRDGWASNQFRTATGVWPNHYRNVQPMEPTPVVRNFVKSMQIRWAMSKKNPVNL